MNNVTVKLRGRLSQYQNSQELILVDPGKTIIEISIALGIPVNQPISALVNGTTVDLNYTLHAGDELQIIPIISGG